MQSEEMKAREMIEYTSIVDDNNECLNSMQSKETVAILYCICNNIKSWAWHRVKCNCVYNHCPKLTAFNLTAFIYRTVP